METVFINGTFDILHPGHLKLFRLAKLYGTVHVAVDSDPRVRQLKGPLRPINTLDNRMQLLSELRNVDHVHSFDSDEELIELIKFIRPNVMIKGADYRDKPIIGANLIKQIIFVDLTDDSTTRTIERISNR